MGYSNSTYAEARAILEKQRIRNEQELEKRRELLYARSERAKQLERNIAKTSIMTARIIFKGGNVREEMEKLKTSNLKAQKELENIIAGFGFPSNYLEIWHKCEKCKDTGYADDRMCECMKKLCRDIEYQKLNETSPLELSSFDTFSLEYYSKTSSGGKESDYVRMSRVLNMCRKYAGSFSNKSKSLLMQGGPGLGKTHLSLAIAREVIDSGYGVLYVSAPVILRQIEKEYFGSQNNESNILNNILECDLLILDDLGTEFEKKFTVSAVYNILNSRMLTSKPTIISTNLSLGDIEKRYDIRTVSRIIGTMERIEFVGTDIRQKKKMQNG